MTGVTSHGFPYPTGTDRIMDGDNAIQALAEAVDLAVFSSPYWRGTVAGGAAIVANATMLWTQVETIGGGGYAAGIYTIPKAGVYRIGATIKFNNGSPAAPPVWIVKRNGVAAMSNANYGAAAFAGMSVDFTLRCALNDTIAFTVNAAGNIMADTPAENTVAAIQYLRA